MGLPFIGKPSPSQFRRFEGYDFELAAVILEDEEPRYIQYAKEHNFRYHIVMTPDIGGKDESGNTLHICLVYYRNAGEPKGISQLKGV